MFGAEQLLAVPAPFRSVLRHALLDCFGPDITGMRILLAIDQFEEVFTQCQDELFALLVEWIPRHLVG